MSDCETTLNWLARLNTGASPDLEQSAQAIAHLSVCAHCSQRKAAYDHFLRDSVRHLSIPPSTAAEEAFILRATHAHASSALSEAFRVPVSPAAEARLLRAVRARTSQRRRLRWFGVLVAAAALLAGVLTATGERPQTPPPQPTVQMPTERVDIEGTAWIDGVQIEATDTLDLRAGVALETAPGSQLRFGATIQAQITLEAQSHLSVDGWGADEVRMALHQGTILAEVEHREQGERFEVTTDNARVIVVGTSFSVSYADQRTVIAATEGVVRVEYLDGTFIGEVRAGHMIEVVDPPKPALPEPPEPPRISPEAPPALPVDVIQTARQLLADGEAEQAIATLVAHAPETWERDALLGDAYQVIGRYTDARRAYEDALRRTASPPAPLLIDLAHLQGNRLSNPAEEAEIWRVYLQHYPDGGAAPKAHLARGRWHQRQQRAADAAAHFQTILDDFPGAAERLEALTALGSALIRAQRWSDAKSLFLAHQSGADLVAETATVGLIRVSLAEGDGPAGEAMIAEYRARFPRGRRRDEVARMEAVLHPSGSEQDREHRPPRKRDGR